MRHRGTVTSWKDDRGYGFIAPEGGGKAVFVHIRAFQNRQRRPTIDAQVTYQLSTDARGRARAEQVSYAEDRRSVRSIGIWLAGLFIALVAAAAVAGLLPREVPVVYLVVSTVTFMVYGFDKAAATGDRRRTPENTLHLLAILGGWPGALIARTVFRHKTKKQPFQWVFRLTILLNLGLFGWMCSTPGGQWLQQLLSSF